MENEPYTDLLALCDAYSQHTNTSHWRVAFLARGDGQFFKRLRGGGGCTVKTSRAVLGWFADNWPSDLEWPRDIQRPAVKRRVA